MIFLWQALAVAQNMVTLHRSADLLSSTNIKPSCSVVSRQLAANYSSLQPRVGGIAGCVRFWAEAPHQVLPS